MAATGQTECLDIAAGGDPLMYLHMYVCSRYICTYVNIYIITNEPPSCPVGKEIR